MARRSPRWSRDRSRASRRRSQSSRLACHLFELAQLGRFAHGDQEIAGLNAVIRRWIEVHALLALVRENNNPALLANPRALNGLAGKTRIAAHANLSDLQVDSEVRGRRIQKAHHVRPKERLRDPLPRK